MLAFKKNAAWQAFYTASAMVIACYIALFFHFGAPYWAVIAVIVAMSNPAIRTLQLQFLLGAMVGAVCGYELMLLIPSNVINLIGINILVSFAVLLYFHVAKYKFFAIFFVVLFLLAFNGQVAGPMNTYVVIMWRCTEIIVGVMVVMLLLIFIDFKALYTPPASEDDVSTGVGPDLKLRALHALKGALSMGLAISIWLTSNIPGGLSGILTSFIVSTESSVTLLWHKAWRRLLGSAIGGSIGIISLHFIIFDLYDLLLIVFVAGAVFSYFSHLSFKHSYSALQANVSFALALIQAGGPTQMISPSLLRLSGVVLGIGCALLVNLIVEFVIKPHHGQLS